MKHYSDYELTRWNTYGFPVKAKEVVILEQDEDFIVFLPKEAVIPGRFLSLAVAVIFFFVPIFQVQSLKWPTREWKWLAAKERVYCLGFLQVKPGKQ